MERDGATARDTRRRRDERGETIVHQPAHRGIDALQHMPERERILRAREREHGANRARSRATLLEVERDQRAHERRRRVLHARHARRAPITATATPYVEDARAPVGRAPTAPDLQAR